MCSYWNILTPFGAVPCRRKEAARDAREEPLLSSFLYAALLSHDTFERSLAFVLANRLSDPTLLATVRPLHMSVLVKHTSTVCLYTVCVLQRIS